MTPDLLRRAAAKIRDTAQAATPGPWEQDYSSVAAGEFVILDALPDDGASTRRPYADAAHAALWSPDVAAPVADLLDSIAGVLDLDARAEAFQIFTEGAITQRFVHPWGDAAEALARRILGESE